MKVSIVGASNFVNRMFEACGQFQWAREFAKNSLEAGASKILFGIEWQAVELFGKYRRLIADNGQGMERDQLLKFFSTLGEGAKKIGGVHDNFGVGAKISSLPWNPDGVVVLSRKSGKSALIHIVLDEDANEYDLVEFEMPDGTKSCVVDPDSVPWPEDDVNWGKVRAEYLSGETGTVIVLLGGEQNPDTILGNPDAGEADIKGLSVYLNTRFWDLSGVEVVVSELRSPKKTQWPAGPDDKDNSRRPNNRRILGARHHIEYTDYKFTAGKIADKGAANLDSDRVTLEWYLWTGERPAIHSYARKAGFIAVRYNGELFQVTNDKRNYRWFGIVEKKVQDNLWLIFDPPHFISNGPKWGVHPDQSRNRLIFSGNGQKGVDLPVGDWATEFSNALPQSVLDAIHAARGDSSGTIDDEEYRKRLQDKFGERWKTSMALVSSPEPKESAPGTNVLVQPEFPDLPPILPNPTLRRPRKNPKTVRVLQPRAVTGSVLGQVALDSPVDIPKYRFGQKDDFERPWHLAAWLPTDPSGPTVLINRDSPILRDAIRFHADGYPDVLQPDVVKAVESVFGEVAVAKVAHSQKLATEIAMEELDREYRNESALTIALMGLLAEDSLIAQRLAKLGKKHS